MTPQRFRLGTDSVLIVRRSNVLSTPRTEAMAIEWAGAIVDAGGHDPHDPCIGETRDQAVERVALQLLDGGLRIVRSDGPERLRGTSGASAPLLRELEQPLDAVVEPRTWVGIRVVDQHGFPVPHLSAEFNLPDGERVDQVLDAGARARVDGVRGEGGGFGIKLTPLPTVFR